MAKAPSQRARLGALGRSAGGGGVATRGVGRPAAAIEKASAAWGCGMAWRRREVRVGAIGARVACGPAHVTLSVVNSPGEIWHARIAIGSNGELWRAEAIMAVRLHRK